MSGAQAMKPVAVLGAGGHAKVLLSLLAIQSRLIEALLDDDPATHGKAIGTAGLTVKGALNTVRQYNPGKVELVNAIGSSHRPNARQLVYERFSQLNYTFATLVHPAAIVASEATIHSGAQIMASAAVQAGAALHANCLINTGSIIDHDTTIGEHTHVAPSATICGGVTVGPSCHIGTGATIVQGMTIGKGVVVGAGATVLENVADGLVVVGTPARPRP